MPVKDQKNSAFQTTHWSIVLRAGGAEASDDARVALQQLCETYWYPLYGYVRRRGCSVEDAKDVTQGFFAQLLANSGIESVEPSKGRFRAFLLASIKNYLRNFWRDQKTLRRGGGVNIISIHELEFERNFQQELCTDDDAERLFERDWAQTLLRRVIDQLREDYVAAGRLELFEVLHPFLVANGDQLPQAQIAERFDLSLSAVKMSVHRMRKQFVGRLRAEIGATIASSDDIDVELRNMITLVRPS